jgi:hypothetical protein
MNSFLTHLVRGDHSLQLAAHLAAGILSLLLLLGAARPQPDAAHPTMTAARLVAPVLVVATTPGTH